MQNQKMAERNDIRTMGEFAELLRGRIGERMGSAYSVQTQVVRKNNGVKLTGITIHARNHNVAPTIYLEKAYDDYKDGMDIDGICERVIQLYEKNVPDQSVDFSFVEDFSWAKGNVCCKLINRESNEEMLEDVPYMEFLDLAVVAYIRFSDLKMGAGSILVKNAQMEKWGVTSDVLFAFAIQNTKALLGQSVTAMAEILMGLNGQGNGEDKEYLDKMQEAVPLYVASNNDKCLGAAVILDNWFLRSFADKIGGDYYILPSSIHETLFLPASYGDAASIKEIVQSINMTQVEACEVLSDNVYLYSRKNGRVEIA